MKKLFFSLALIGSFYSLSAKVYATVGNKQITDVDINQILRVIPNGALIEKFGGIDRLDEKMKRQIIDMAIDNYLLAQKAYKEGIDKTKEYQQELENIKNSLATQLYTQKIVSQTTVDDKEAKEYYEKHKEEFKAQKDMVKARHILVKTQKEAEDIIKQLQKAKNKEELFIKLAKEKSIGPSGVNGGELGWFEKKMMVPEFSKVAFALKKGEFTQKPVKTKFGYHIILVEDKIKKGDVKPFSEVKEQIKAKLKNEKIKQKLNDIIKNLREEYKSKIKYN